MSSTRNKLIQLLAERKDQFTSGQLLSEKLQISRSAIWKHMRELEKDGYIIEGKSNRGYRISGYPSKLSENTIQWGLSTKWLGKKIIHKESTTSTQRLAHQAALDHAEHGTVIIADQQTEGKGRMDRSWYSTKEKGIWMSIILRPRILPYLAPQLTLLAATVIADVIHSISTVKPQIKWPNDILINRKKLAGILTEMQAEQDKIQYVVIGMGLNINQSQTELPEGIRSKATSLKVETDQAWNLQEVIQKMLVTFERKYTEYMENGFPGVKNEWENYGFRLNEAIWIKTMQSTWLGTFIGISEDGALLAETKDREVKKVYSAEISWFDEGEEYYAEPN
ncbi:biotin--[acetyl-CoA-carboxylase] ligase [Virgibacillus sp. W0181]|uniref:biotin--[acetyl-CoA-carboxylase] ligase n=1 Tax=Virgibacillus sp. W0181 TaxID=3391581 RepID=UPI003F462941